jgi:uncharacterized protein (UPF0548 family)
MKKPYTQIHHATFDGVVYRGREALLQLIQRAKDDRTMNHLLMFCGADKKDTKDEK